MLYLPSIPLLRIHPSIVLSTLSFYLITLFCYGHLRTYMYLVIFLKLLLEFLHSMVVLYIKIFCICIFSFTLKATCIMPHKLN